MHSESSTGRSFELDLAAIHTAHSLIRQRLSWLSQLLHSKTDMLPELCRTFSWDENEMVRPTRIRSFSSFSCAFSTNQKSNFWKPLP